MKIVCIGGGPSGLFFAIFMKLRRPEHEITVYERCEADDTFGWGVVLSDQVIEELLKTDRPLVGRIRDQCAEWGELELRLRGRKSMSSGHGYIGIGRHKMLDLLHARALELGVTVHYGREIKSVSEVGNVDLIIATDGINSRTRSQFAQHFEPDLDVRKNRYIWLGTKQPFPAFTFAFEQTEHGWYQAHAYQFDADTSTFIVECSEETFQAEGLQEMSEEQSLAFCESLFSEHLGGHPLMVNGKHLRGSRWLTFQRVDNAHWHHDNVVLLGDAAHTAHFSIGSGTRLGLGDAIELTRNLDEFDCVQTALVKYEEARRLAVQRIQSAARNSTEWFENVPRYIDLPHEQFFYSMLTRSQRVSHESLRQRDPEWLQSYERWFAEQCDMENLDTPPPPMFTPYKLRQMELANRVVMSPMSTYSATDGLPGTFHLVHLGARAMGGAALLITEMTAIAEDARATPRCTGIYSEAHVAAWRKITDFAHQNGNAKMAIQLGHAGPRAGTNPPSDGRTLPLETDGWCPVGPTATQAWPGYSTPRMLSADEMEKIIGEYVEATHRAESAGFDMIELHAAHGYLLAAFLSPVLNRRTDRFGGDVHGRLSFPLSVFKAIREVWPADKPMSVRISATDWVEGGLSPEDSLIIATAFFEAGADIIDVSAGQTTPSEKPVYGRMFQTPLSDKIRNEGKIPTMAVGNIYHADHVNSIIGAGRADLCCIGRPHLVDPNWTLRAAVELGVPVLWPKQYEIGAQQLQRIRARKEDLVIQV